MEATTMLACLNAVQALFSGYLAFRLSVLKMEQQRSQKALNGGASGDDE